VAACCIGRPRGAPLRIWGEMGRSWGIEIAGPALAAMLWPIAGAFAQTLPTAAGLCRLESIGIGKVHSALDGRSFLLDDGREIRLPGIDVPIPPRTEESGAGAKAAGANAAGANAAGANAAGVKAGISARAALHAMLAGAEVDLRKARRLSIATAASWPTPISSAREHKSRPPTRCWHQALRGFLHPSGMQLAPRNSWRGKHSRVKANLAFGVSQSMQSSVPRVSPSFSPDVVISRLPKARLQRSARAAALYT